MTAVLLNNLRSMLLKNLMSMLYTLELWKCFIPTLLAIDDKKLFTLYFTDNQVILAEDEYPYASVIWL